MHHISTYWTSLTVSKYSIPEINLHLFYFSLNEIKEKVPEQSYLWLFQSIYNFSLFKELSDFT